MTNSFAREQTSVFERQVYNIASFPLATVESFTQRMKHSCSAQGVERKFQRSRHISEVACRPSLLTSLGTLKHIGVLHPRRSNTTRQRQGALPNRQQFSVSWVEISYVSACHISENIGHRRADYLYSSLTSGPLCTNATESRSKDR